MLAGFALKAGLCPFFFWLVSVRCANDIAVLPVSRRTGPRRAIRAVK